MKEQNVQRMCRVVNDKMESNFQFDSKKQAVETLTKLFVSGNLNRGIVDEAESRSKTIKEELEKLKKANQEKHALYIKAQSIPELMYPKRWSLKYAGPIYQDDLDTYILSRDLAELKQYLLALQNGLCASEDFRNKSGFEATAYLSAAIRRREAAPKSTEAQPTAKDIENFNAKADKIAKKQNDLEKQVKTLSTPTGTVKSKAYTA